MRRNVIIEIQPVAACRVAPHGMARRLAATGLIALLGSAAVAEPPATLDSSNPVISESTTVGITPVLSPTGNPAPAVDAPNAAETAANGPAARIAMGPRSDSEKPADRPTAVPRPTGTLKESVGVLMPTTDHHEVQSTIEMRIAKRPWLIEKLMGKSQEHESEAIAPRHLPDPPSLSRFGSPGSVVKQPTAKRRPVLRQPTASARTRSAGSAHPPELGRTPGSARSATNTPSTPRAQSIPDDGWVAVQRDSVTPPTRQETSTASVPRRTDGAPSRMPLTQATPPLAQDRPSSTGTPATPSEDADASLSLVAPKTASESSAAKSQPTEAATSRRTATDTLSKRAAEPVPKRQVRLPSPKAETDRQTTAQSRPERLQPLPRRRLSPLRRMPDVEAHGSIGDLAPQSRPASRSQSASQSESASRSKASPESTAPEPRSTGSRSMGSRSTTARPAKPSAPTRSADGPETSDVGPRDYAGYPAESITLGSSARKMKASLSSTLSYYYRKREIAPRRSNWGMLHAMMVYGADTRVIAGRTHYSTIAWIAGNNACRGQRVFEIDSRGLAIKDGPGLQGHQGQLMAIFALCGVPEDYPIYVSGKSYSMQDVIRREMADCKAGAELTFTLIGLAHYLPTDSTWTTPDGESWSIERLIQEELAQPVVGAACGGTHRLMGFAHALRNRRIEGKPITGQWARAEKFTQDFQDYAYRLQNRDGSMSTDWFEGRADNGDVDRKIQTTGHIVEWLLTITPDSELQNPRLVAATNFLLRAMAQGRSRDWSIGPKGHALRSLAMYYERVYRSGTGWQAGNVASRSRTSRR